MDMNNISKKVEFLESTVHRIKNEKPQEVVDAVDQQLVKIYQQLIEELKRTPNK